MISNDTIIDRLISICSSKIIRSENIVECCKIIHEKLNFDCVFLAHSTSSEETLSPLACYGKEEVMETCLYRLGVEEKITLTKLPLKAYLDMTGKPVFNKAGSLRIQKPNSGIFMVLNRPKKNYILFGCAHQNSQPYEQKTLEELSSIWKNWQEPLESAVKRLDDHSAPSPVLKTEERLLEPKPEHLAGPVHLRPPENTITESQNDGRRPVVLVDEVTRLYNKAYFTECLGIEVERAKRYSRWMSLVFLSVAPVEGVAVKVDDNLVAIQIAEILSKSLRRVDVICRLDKHKYGIILPDTANNTYGIIAKRIFKYFKQIMGDTPSVFLNISASTYPKHAADHIALLENTEKLLLQAQEVGPNKAVLPE